MLDLKSTKIKLIFALVAGIIIILLFILASNLKLAKSEWKIVKTTPIEQAFHNPNLPIEITFNQPVQLKNISLAIEPKTEHRLLPGPNSNTVLVQPKTSFLAETNYILTVNTPVNHALMFKTGIQAGNAVGWNEGYSLALEKETQFNNIQDNALRTIRRSVPISQIGFSVNYRYKDNTYVISLAAPYEASKAKTLDWFKQQGVTDLKYVRLEWKQ